MPTYFSILQSKNLGSANATISLTGLPVKKYLIVEGYLIPTAALITQLRLNNDSSGVDGTSGNYVYRLSSDGGADATSTNKTQVALDGSSGTPIFFRIYITSISTKEKMMIGHVVDQNTAGVANAPDRTEFVAKWVNTTDAINEIDIISNTSTFATGSEVTVWGSDFLSVSDTDAFTDTVTPTIKTKGVFDTDAFTDTVTVSKKITKGISDTDAFTDTVTHPKTISVSDTDAFTDTVSKNYSISKKIIIKYNILNTVNKTDTIKYDLLNTVNKTNTIKYDILNLVQKPITIIYDILNQVTTTVTIKYDIFSAVTKVLIVKYDILNSIIKKIIIKYSLDSLYKVAIRGNTHIVRTLSSNSHIVRTKSIISHIVRLLS